MEQTMLYALWAISVFLITRVWQKKGIEIHEILVLTNILYFFFSGIYHQWYSDGEASYDDETVFIGYMGIILYATGIMLGAGFIKSDYFFYNMKESRSSALHAFKNYYETIRTEAVSVLFVISLFLRYLYFIKEGRIIYGMESIDGETPLSYPISALFLFWGIINNGLFTYALINIIFRKQGQKIFCTCVIATELAFSLISRRDFAFNVVIILIVYLTTTSRITFRAFITSAALSLLTVMFILPFIFDFRKKLANQYFDTGEINIGIDQVFGGDPADTQNQGQYMDNLATRGYIIASNFELIDTKISKSVNSLNGSVFLSSLTFITPYYLFPGKRNTAPPDELILEHFDLPAYDHSENIPYAAYADFGFYGPLLYGLFIGLTVAIIQRYCTQKLHQHPFASICSLMYLLVHCLNFEVLPIIHFILIRNIAIIYIASIILSTFLNNTYWLSRISKRTTL